MRPLPTITDITLSAGSLGLQLAEQHFLLNVTRGQRLTEGFELYLVGNSDTLAEYRVNP
jgi:hypothetical protein